jgi:hypothetical protein
MSKRFLLVLVLIAAVSGCTTSQCVKTPDPNEPPVILGSYAAEYIRPGANWRVYLKAEDAEGDMNSIVVQIWQPGVGYYPTAFTYLEGGNRQGFAGYLFLKTPPDGRLLQDQFHLEAFVRDCGGNKSETVKLILRFDNRGGYEALPVPGKWQEAANNELGVIQVQIISSELYNSDDGGKNIPAF